MSADTVRSPATTRPSPARSVPRPTVVWTIARTELRRRWRALVGNTGQLLAIAFLALLAVPFGAIGVGLSYLLGSELAAGEVVDPVRSAAAVVAAGWVGVAAFGGYRAYASALRPDRLDGLLTTVSHRDLIGGLALAELLLWACLLVIPVVLAALSFAVGAGSPLAVPALLAAVALTLATALTFGFVVALGVRNLGARSRLLSRLRTVAIAALGIAYIWLIVTESFATVLGPAADALAPTPVGWFGHLALVGTIPSASPLLAAGALVAAGLFLVAGWPALSRLSGALWYADGVARDDSSAEPGSSSRHAGGPLTALASRLAAVLPRPVWGVVAVDWTRARRRPIALSFVIYPLFALIGPVTATVEAGRIGSGLALWVALSFAWVTGALFTLNVLGFEGAALPTTLLGSRPGRTLVLGHSAAGALLGVPLAVVATLVLGLASPMAPLRVVTLSVGAGALACCAGPLATGVGAVFPRFEAVNVTRSSKAVVPSTFAFGAYSLVLLLTALPLLLAHSVLVGHAIADAAGAPFWLVGAGGTLVTAVVAGVLALGSAAYAVRRVGRYTIE